MRERRNQMYYWYTVLGQPLTHKIFCAQWRYRSLCVPGFDEQFRKYLWPIFCTAFSPFWWIEMMIYLCANWTLSRFGTNQPITMQRDITCVRTCSFAILSMFYAVCVLYHSMIIKRGAKYAMPTKLNQLQSP